MQIDDMRIFVTTVDAGNFTAAARRLTLSKQFVSRRVMTLEAALGVRLLIRNTRKLAVTDLGQDFYQRARRILGEIDDAQQAMAAGGGALRGLLRISAPMSFGMTHLSPLVSAFLRQHPDVRFDMDLSDRTVDVVGEGFDMAVRIGTLADSTLIAQRLGDVRMVAACSPAYRKRRGAPMTPADLDRHACLMYGGGRATGWEFVVDGRAVSVNVSGPLRTNNGEVIRDAAMAGLGVALLPEFLLADALASGGLVEVLADCARPATGLYALYPQHREGSATVRAFTQFLRERLKAATATARAVQNKAKSAAPGKKRIDME